MGASLALAGVSACTRQPPEKLVPYVRQPEEIVPGRPLFFATAMPQGGVGMPLLAENHMGRPTKLEGNPEHPASLGATDLFSQASVLTLYDPDRSRTVINRGEVKTWGAFVDGAVRRRSAPHAQQRRRRAPPADRAGFVAVARRPDRDACSRPCRRRSGTSGMPSTARVRAARRRRRRHLPASTRPTSSSRSTRTSSASGPASVRYTKDFSSRRRMGTPDDAAEPSLRRRAGADGHRRERRIIGSR